MSHNVSHVTDQMTSMLHSHVLSEDFVLICTLNAAGQNNFFEEENKY